MSSDNSPILKLVLAKGVGVKTLSHLLERPEDDELPIEQAVALPPEELVKRYGLRDAVAEGIRSAQPRAEALAQELEQLGVQVLVRGREPYPRKLVEVLGPDAPPVLFAKGDLSILHKRAVGFCGARSASQKGVRVAGDSARALAAVDVNVVSGYAKGVDLAAHRAALEAGGVTTIVLAEGIQHFRAKQEIKALLNDENSLIVSEFLPRLPWSARNAMQRNKTICGLSDAVVVIESGMKGGTFAAAESALALKLPLFVAEYAQPAPSAAGNQHFIQRGATPLRGNLQGQPNLARVFEVLRIPEAGNPQQQADDAPAAPSEGLPDAGPLFSNPSGKEADQSS